MTNYCLIGGVAGGATAAARLRRIDEHAEITIFERGAHISYANCGLPYYIGGTIAERDKLFVQTPETFGARFNVAVKVNSDVIAIHPDTHSITVRDLTSGKEYEQKYDKLVLSPGAEPLKPPIPGIQDNAIFTLRNVPDTDAIKEFVDSRHVKKAVVVGAGFIGLEMAENLHHRGINVTIVEMAEQVMTPLDYEMAAEVHQHLKTKNVEFYLKDAVASFSRKGETLAVNLSSGKSISADIVILSIGVRPDTKLAKEAGLALGKSGGIVVNEFLQTSSPDIYAVGDAIEFANPITKEAGITYLAGPANKQGRIAADNIVFGNTRKYLGSISTAIAKVFDLTVASTGVSEKTLKRLQIPYLTSITHSSSHAGYYPGAVPMSVKIVFAPKTGTLFGAQIVGYEGVDKRIDLFAAVVKNNGTIYDLEEIEHAYAPPYSSAKDPVNIAGFAAENILTGAITVVQWYDVMRLREENALFLDVRTPDEFALGSIDGAINIPIDSLRTRMGELPKDKTIVVFCGVGLRGYVALKILLQHGYTKVCNLSGGYKTFEHATQKQSNEDIFAHDSIHKDDMIYQVPESSPASGTEINVDACGLQCPGPIMKLKKAIEAAHNGDKLIVSATDPGFAHDVKSWCSITGNELAGVTSDKGMVKAIITKREKKEQPMQSGGNGKTIVVFSDDMDKALASFVIANGAASTGAKVTMFFTFWGLNVIKRKPAKSVKKDFMGRMFSLMLPSSSKKLKLSKLNMGGMGTIMMRNRMISKKVDSLESMIQSAIDSGIELVACQMSMDVMGVAKEELMDAVTVGGVAVYLERAGQANVNLFI